MDGWCLMTELLETGVCEYDGTVWVEAGHRIFLRYRVNGDDLWE